MKGAVIVAAGMSSRMGDFKPMMQIGTRSMIEQIVYKLSVLSVKPIVIVTGNRAKEIEQRLKHLDVVFLRNENYETTQMFDSAKIGFEFIKDKCEKIIFTPVDVPMFDIRTILKILAADAQITVPECKGRDGHPICMDTSILPSILNYKGNGGLRGAIAEGRWKMQRVAVDDEGILIDADTKADYQKLVNLYRNQVAQKQVIQNGASL